MDEATAAQGVPTTYEDFVAETGHSAVMTEQEFSARRARGDIGVSACADYQDYLAAMFQKYKE